VVCIAENARKCTIDVEKGIFDGAIPISDQTYKEYDSGTCCLIREATKAFGELKDQVGMRKVVPKANSKFT
jgi:hypothetical protein